MHMGQLRQPLVTLQRFQRHVGPKPRKAITTLFLSSALLLI